ncbi:MULTISPECIES: alpha-L-fucosidase [unclassified Microbulbifer]|uniref:alpha-L-fucosidase n=1 Tax=unclassified Microbulbifer TaxID=2619833 RepID=UPI0027E5B28E|nr:MULTISPECIES: alpha-L-fucosidase [unclassified Microbulbifer]
MSIRKNSLWAACSLALSITQAPIAAHANDRTADCPTDKTSQQLDKPNYNIPLVEGPFDSSVESLKTYQTPTWFRDAKFGIWAHWGPQAVPRAGDWYARNMYIQESAQYKHHVEHYGHPTKFGYKDIIPLWKAEKFDPEALMDLYAKAGAKYFVSMGVHHDNFDLWDSKHHRWNAVDMGPNRDIVGDFKKAAEKRGLRFGVSEHLGASYTWFTPSHGFDRLWTPEAYNSYDGADPAYKDLYHNGDEPFKWKKDTWYAKNPAWHQQWFDRITDLVERYQPDLLYTDGGIPFGEVGRTLVANFYNQNISTHNGDLEAVYNHKDHGTGEFIREAGVQDVERGVMSDINPLPWQTDTSIGDWYYSDGFEYKPTSQVVHMLADIVSKNGNLLLNVVQYPDGSLPPEPLQFLREMADWMEVNGEAIYGTRPWVIYGEGPTESSGGSFSEGDTYTAEDVRFTKKNETLYAIALGLPKKQVRIKALGLNAEAAGKKIKSVELLGYPKALKWAQDNDALTIKVPGKMPTKHAVSFKVEFI